MKKRKGLSLIEVLVAVAILGIFGVALLAALSSSTRVAIKTDSYETGRDLAVAQMEYVKKSGWDGTSYAPDSTILPAGWGADISVANLQTENGNATLQQITVVVSQNGNEVTRLQDYKVSPARFGD